MGYLWWRNSTSLEAQARCFVIALERDDFQQMASFALPEERRGTQLEKDLAYVLPELLAPELSKCQRIGSLESDITPDGTLATASIQYRVPNGEYVDVGSSFSSTESGAKGIVLWPILACAWITRSKLDPAYDRSTWTSTRALLTGLRADRARLEQAGVVGVYRGPERGFMHWQKLEAYLVEVLGRRERERAAHK